MKLEFIDNTKDTIHVNEILYENMSKISIGMRVSFDSNHPAFPWLGKVTHPITAQIVNLRPRFNGFTDSPYSYTLTFEFPTGTIAGHDGGMRDGSKNRWHWSIHRTPPIEAPPTRPRLTAPAKRRVRLSDVTRGT